MVLEAEHARRLEPKGPKTYTDQKFLDGIFAATRLVDFMGPAIIVDMKSGKGIVAEGMRARDPQKEQRRYIALESSEALAAKITNPDIEVALGSIEEMPFEDASIDVAVIRYRLKDVPEEQQKRVLREIRRVLEPEGTLVLADMIALEGSEEWLNKQHSRKQQLSGRDPQKDGECHILTEAGWLEMLVEAGFEAEVVGHHTSYVNTKDWVKGGQIDEAKRAEMDMMILGAPEPIREALNIRQEEDGVHIDYPVAIIQAKVRKEI